MHQYIRQAKHKKGFVNIIIVAIGVIILVGAVGYFIGSKQLSLPNPSPTFSPGQEQVFLREGQREGPLLVEKIYPDYITGLNFLEYPVPFEKGLPITLRIGEVASNGCTITLTLIRIEGDIATFIKKVSSGKDTVCPICLAGDTLIDTPAGSISVKDLQVGMPVWTINKTGQRVSGVIIKTSKMSVPSTHQMVHLAFDDGRELFVSPGHPTFDGRIVGNLASGDSYNGVFIVSVERVSYNETATYDILPSGDTGFYWANGILIGSTLRVPVPQK